IGNSGEDVYILNTHLHPMSTPIRLSQLLEIYDWRIKNPSLKLIVNGDFNSDPNSIEIRFIRDVMGLQDSYLSLKGSYPDNYCTYCTDNPRSFAKKNHIFDYIFYSSVSANFPNTKLYPIYYERNLTGSEKWSYSDHYGVLARFYLENMVPGQETKIPLQDSNVIIKTLEEVETILSNEHKSMYNQDIAYVENLKKTLTKE
ncbi:MAG: hypothetical protein KDD45_15540, partial [Bdellovibrionales bacterium]|nr:hypothetical protein [Bdellovibrionales bacterium]